MNILKNKKIFVFLFILILALISYLSFNRTLKHPLKVKEDVIITVENGDNFYSILNTLNENNQIKSLKIIKTYLKVTGNVVDVKPGQYKLHNNMSVKDIIEVFDGQSAINIVDFTVPEGFTIDEIADKLEKEDIFSKSEFINAIMEYHLPEYVKASKFKRYNLEGFLFPDTYKISAQSTPEELIDSMVLKFEEVWKTSLESSNLNINKNDVEKVITIASMVEKEARVDKERPTIASVIYNRLDPSNNQERLKIDATVLYALGEHKEKVSLKDLEIDSLFNTYSIKGLPVGAISNPGEASILAALNPAKTDYLFYVLQTDGSNSHYFTNNDVDFMNKLKELGYEP